MSPETKQNKFVIQKSEKVGGEISVKGAKNHALKVLAAAVLTDQEIIIENIPEIEDIKRKEELLSQLGVALEREGDTLKVNAKNINTTDLDPNKSSTIRTSIILAAALLSRFGKVKFFHPGGCILGKRPVDLFLDGFQKLGAELSYGEDGIIELVAPKGKLVGNDFFFPKISVTATEALMIAAVLAKGTTVLKNVALEPEIVALAEFLNNCGAKITGAGTPIIRIEGVEKISGGSCSIISDRIETGTFIILGLLNNSDLKITNCDPVLSEALLVTLKKAGANFEVGNDFVRCLPSGPLKASNIITHEYPGFATDIQPPFTVLMTQAEGLSLIHDPIFEGRLFFTDSLVQMGARIIMCDPHRIVIQGPTPLVAKKLASPDIRAGIALVLAGSIAQGKTIIDNVYQIDRGYADIENRLRSIGVDIERTE